jgi:hypothetical protein
LKSSLSRSVKKDPFRISLSPQEEQRLLILETQDPRKCRPVFRRQNTKPQLTEEDRERIQEHAQRVIQRENVPFLHKASSDSAILDLTEISEISGRNKCQKTRKTLEKKRARSRITHRRSLELQPALTHKFLKSRNNNNILSTKSGPGSIRISKDTQTDMAGSLAASGKYPLPKPVIKKSRDFTDYRTLSLPKSKHIRVQSTGDAQISFTIIRKRSKILNNGNNLNEYKENLPNLFLNK